MLRYIAKDAKDSSFHFQWFCFQQLMCEMIGSYVTNVCTPGSKVLLEKLTCFQLVKKFPAFY